MELAILIALAALAVDIIDTMFNIGGRFTLSENATKKKSDRPRLPNCTVTFF